MYYANSFFPYFTKKYNLLDKKIRSQDMKEFKTSMTEILKPHKRKHYAAGSKHLNSLLTSIRLGQSDLNAHKFKVSISDTMTCTLE